MLKVVNHDTLYYNLRLYASEKRIDGDVSEALRDRAAELEKDLEVVQASDEVNEAWKASYSQDTQARIQALRDLADQVES